MELANGPPDLSKIRHSQYVNSCQLARRLGHFAAWGMNTTTTTTTTTITPLLLLNNCIFSTTTFILRLTFIYETNMTSPTPKLGRPRGLPGRTPQRPEASHPVEPLLASPTNYGWRCPGIPRRKLQYGNCSQVCQGLEVPGSAAFRSTGFEPELHPLRAKARAPVITGTRAVGDSAETIQTAQ